MIGTFLAQIQNPKHKVSQNQLNIYGNLYFKFGFKILRNHDDFEYEHITCPTKKEDIKKNTVCDGEKRITDLDSAGSL